MNGANQFEQAATPGTAPGLPQTLRECHLLIAQQALLLNQLQGHFYKSTSKQAGPWTLMS